MPFVMFFVSILLMIILIKELRLSLAIASLFCVLIFTITIKTNDTLGPMYASFYENSSSIMNNIKKYAELGKNAVIGTTGWYDHIEEIRKLVETSGIGLIYSSNFSIGVNIFNRIVERAAELFDKFDMYDVAGIEYHHNRKADSPSGTAIGLANILKDGLARKKEIVYKMMDRRIEPHELHFASVRCGSITGKHEIIFDSNADSIQLIHSAKNREGFAAGALEAAKWIHGRKGFFNIDDLVREIMND
jgi:4-hydroxy-tetrahydrodipicolinate reductase